MGVDCGPHSTYGTTCAITFAGGFREKTDPLRDTLLYSPSIRPR